jgi:hypothetical protein
MRCGGRKIRTPWPICSRIAPPPNRSSEPGASERPKWTRQLGGGVRRDTLRFAGFLGKGFVIGLLGFRLIPILAGSYLSDDHAEYGSNLFLFWTFINIHHNFIDNAMWRKENPHTLKHLFTKR